MGNTAVTAVKHKTLFPGFYETKIFDELMIPEARHFEYASQVCFRLYDEVSI